jgi:hypothetical protein
MLVGASVVISFFFHKRTVAKRFSPRESVVKHAGVGRSLGTKKANLVSTSRPASVMGGKVESALTATEAIESTDRAIASEAESIGPSGKSLTHESDKNRAMGKLIPSQLETDAEITAMLDSKKLTNPREAFRNSAQFTELTPAVESLRATYEGELLFNSGVVWQMKIKFDPALAKNLVNANLEVDIFKDNTLLPPLAYKSELRQQPGMLDEPDAILLQIIQTNYLQLFYFEKLDIWGGNYYVQGQNGSSQIIGTISLRRIEI